MRNYNTPNFSKAREKILLINDDNSTQELFYNQALDIANERGLDLLEVSRTNDKSIYKILDKGKWLYEQKKKTKAQKKNAHVSVMKEVQFGMRTELHDIETKVNHIKEFLDKGFEVKIVLDLKGREKANIELAKSKIKSILDMFEHTVKQNTYKISGNNICLIVNK